MISEIRKFSGCSAFRGCGDSVARAQGMRCFRVPRSGNALKTYDNEGAA